MSESGFLEQVLESLPDAVVLVDRDGQILYANREAERLFGYQSGELVGLPIETLVPSGTREAHPDYRESYFKHPHARPSGVLELIGRRAGGEEFPADIALCAVETSKGIVAAAVVREMQARVAAEREREALTEQLQAAQRLESVGQLAGGIAHDFNNLLSVILNYAGFAIRALPEGDPARADIEQIQLAGERAAALTHQLLLFSRREVARPEVIDLNTVVTDLERLLRRSIGEQVRLVVSLAGNLRPVFVDPHKLEQVLLNLAVNSRDAMSGGGTLEIETANVDLDARAAQAYPGMRAGRHVALTVTDDGVGMTPDIAARAFEPFFSAKAKGSGSGLGLATAHGIVRQAGGSITLTSEPDKGTVVSILLPATERAEPAEQAGEAAPPHATGAETVLVVEDERAVLELTRRILTQAGYEVLAVGGSGEAILACERATKPIDLLLSDMVLPQVSGVELARRVRELQPNIRVAFMTGYSREFLERHANLGEAVPVVEKPFTTDRLLKGVRIALDAEPAELPAPE